MVPLAAGVHPINHCVERRSLVNARATDFRWDIDFGQNGGKMLP